MRRAVHRTGGRIVIGVAVLVMTSCAEQAPLAPSMEQADLLRPGESAAPQLASAGAADVNRFLATLRRVTARYHDLSAALADGFVALHPCEERPGEGPVGALYVHFGNLLDGVIDPQAPDALLYEPARNGREKLVGVEFAVPYALWPDAQPPSLFGAAFQREDEFGVYALHVWVWRHNPEGMFAESNPNVSCTAG